MNIIRFTGRLMLSSYFVARGVKNFLNPNEAILEHPELAEKMVSATKKIVPNSVEQHIPQEPSKFVRYCAGAQAVGGVLLGTGLASRIGAGIVFASMAPHVIEKSPVVKGETLNPKSWLNQEFLTNAALAGAALVITQDTKGKPSLLWRLFHPSRSFDKTVTNLGNKN